MLNEPLLESRRQGRKEKVHVAKNSLARSLARPDFQALLVASSPEFVNSRSNFVGAGTTLLRFDGTSPLPDGLAGPSAPLPLLFCTLRDDPSLFHLSKRALGGEQTGSGSIIARSTLRSCSILPSTLSNLPPLLPPSSSFARGTWTPPIPLHPPGL